MRRALVAAGVAALASVYAVAACGGSSPVAASSLVAASSPVAGCGGSSGASAASMQLVTQYEPSQATGWPALYSRTVGGHESCVQVSYGHKTYRISLLPFGQPGSSPNPVYEAIPKDPDVAFKRTLTQQFGGHYAFRYRGGLPSGAEFVIESYGVHLYRRTNGLVWGSDLYAVYKPGKTGPAIDSDLQFIQVYYSIRLPSGGGADRHVDTPRSNSPAPYYGEGAGLTTINGRQIVNFYDPGPGVLGPVSPHGGTGPQVDRLETFLAKETGRKNPAGMEVVDIYGGIKWGFAFKAVA